MDVTALATGTGSDELFDLAVAHPDATICISDPGETHERFESAFGSRVHFGPGAVTEVAATKDATVINAIVGVAGLPSSLSALYAGNRLCLANKESLIAGGPLLLEALEDGNGELIPVDSEHSAIWQCIVGEDSASVERLILTASGGPFRGRPSETFADISVAEALDHPTWSMGPRISIDSATLMNKAFEVVEAHYLFGIDYENIEVVVHPESMIHSFVEFSDGVVKAEVGFPDMRKPIQYAITSPARVAIPKEPFSIVGSTMRFEEVDRDTFPCLDLGYDAGRMGGTATAVLNAADEAAVEAFLVGRIGFLDIARAVSHVLSQHDARTPRSVEDVMDADTEARMSAEQFIATLPTR